jgi:hypothetical protein
MPDGRRLLPLYEGKMFWHYDHRYGTYEGQTVRQANKGVLPRVSEGEHADPAYSILHRYWVPEELVEGELKDRWSRQWMLGFRDVGPSERTLVSTVVPRTAAGDKSPLIFSEAEPIQCAFLASVLSSLVVDYAIRQKTSSSVKLFVIKQAPVLPPPSSRSITPWGDALLGFVVPRVIELSCTNYELVRFAVDCGVAAAPFKFCPDRRPLLQAELDALFFHLYGLDRSDTEWVLDTFAVLRKYEEKGLEKGGYGEYRTKRLILERYDAMAEAEASGTDYQTVLDPPPADPSIAHDPSTRPYWADWYLNGAEQ